MWKKENFISFVQDRWSIHDALDEISDTREETDYQTGEWKLDSWSWNGRSPVFDYWIGETEMDGVLKKYHQLRERIQEKSQTEKS
ncbi:MAG: hypothetical protein ABI318_15585 [Chthoniobacteraceae bacterium]